MGVKLEVFRVSDLWSGWAAGFFPDLTGRLRKAGIPREREI